MTQQGPNPIELYEGAVQAMIPIMRGVQQGLLSAASSCTEWNLQQLVTHNLTVPDFFGGIIQGNITVDPRDVSGAIPSEGAEAAFTVRSNKVLELLKAERDLSRVVETPFGQMPLGHVIMLPFSDVVIHKWDIAKATNQDTSIDSGLAEVCFGVLSQQIEQARQMGAFGPEVSVPISASIQNKLLGLTGRQP